MFSETHGNRPNVPNIAVMVYDGESDNPAEVVNQARLLRDADVTVLALAIGEWVRMEHIQAIASHPKIRNVLKISSHNAIFTATDVLLSAVCNSKSTIFK